MAACSRGLVAPPFDVKAGRAAWPRPARAGGGGLIRCCCAEPELRRRVARAAAAAPERAEEWRIDGNKPAAASGGGRRRVGVAAMPFLPSPSPRSRRLSKQQDFYPRCTPRGPAPQSRDTPPKRVRRTGGSTCWTKRSRSSEQMKMAAHGTGKAGKTSARMGIGAAGRGWEGGVMMVPPNGKRRYMSCALLGFNGPSHFLGRNSLRSR